MQVSREAMSYTNDARQPVGNGLEGDSHRSFVGNWVSGTRKEKMNRNYAALRLWSTVLIVIGIVGVILVVIGTIVAMIEAVTFLQALAILLIGGPLAALFASWPIALGQGLRALADVAEYVRDQQRNVR
jgi:uncharacterized membrane protein